MPRTWSNIKYTETRSAAQKVKNKPSSLTLFTFLMVFNLLLFGGLVAYTLVRVFVHPAVEAPLPTQPPKDD